MNPSRWWLPLLVLLSSANAAAAGTVPASASAAVLHDGQRDFDWAIGRWKTQLKRRLHPLTGSNEWVEYSGTTMVRKVWDGNANLVELDVKGPAGRIEGLSLRLYNPESRQWSLNFANRAMGALVAPTIGEFKNGRGEFYNSDTLNGRAILVRFVMSEISADLAFTSLLIGGKSCASIQACWASLDIQ